MATPSGLIGGGESPVPGAASGCSSPAAGCGCFFIVVLIVVVVLSSLPNFHPPAPVITSVSLITPLAKQTFVISGRGFGSPTGSKPDYQSHVWIHAPEFHGFDVKLIVGRWTNDRIVINGLGGDYGGGACKCDAVMHNGEQAVIGVTNITATGFIPASEAATWHVTIGVGAAAT